VLLKAEGHAIFFDYEYGRFYKEMAARSADKVRRILVTGGEYLLFDVKAAGHSVGKRKPEWAVVRQPYCGFH